jgi:hypothetical protein
MRPKDVRDDIHHHPPPHPLHRRPHHQRNAQHYIPFSCAQIAWFYTNYALGSSSTPTPMLSLPNATISNDTTSTSTSDVYVAVNANFNGTPDQIGASLDVNFGMAIWLALFCIWSGWRFI